jgi:hypothetical protein
MWCQPDVHCNLNGILDHYEASWGLWVASYLTTSGADHGIEAHKVSLAQDPLGDFTRVLGRLDLFRDARQGAIEDFPAVAPGGHR